MRGSNMTFRHISLMSSLYVCVVDTDTLLLLRMLYFFVFFLFNFPTDICTRLSSVEMSVIVVEKL